jgi:hypothetical protein
VIYSQQIRAWYRWESGVLLKTDTEPFKELFTGALDSVPLKPQHKHMNHFYSHKFYNM